MDRCFCWMQKKRIIPYRENMIEIKAEINFTDNG